MAKFYVMLALTPRVGYQRMFLGEFRHQLDAKNRMRIPAKLRNELGETFVVTKGGSGCLFVFSQKNFEDLYKKIDNVPISDAAAQKSVRGLFSAAAEVQNDDQGRALLPQNLKEFARIDKNIVIIGAGNRLEIWSEEVWNAYNTDESFDKVLGELSKFGV